MKRITVYADFDFLSTTQEIGVLGYEHIRGKDHFVFEYSRQWLKCLLIDPYTEQSDINALLAASENYMLERQEATEIIDEVRAAIKDWRKTATEVQIPLKQLESYSIRQPQKCKYPSNNLNHIQFVGSKQRSLSKLVTYDMVVGLDVCFCTQR